MSNLEYLKNALALIRSTSKPVEDDDSKKANNSKTLNDQWNEVEALVAKMEQEEKVAPDSGSSKIAAKVKEVLDEQFPGAKLNIEPVNTNPRIVMFMQGGQDYRLIQIDPEY